VTLQERLSPLRELGVQFTHDYKYVGHGEDRHRVELPDAITSVFLPFSPEEWCGIAMREGEFYVGGCCGNTGAIQDEINGAFRDSGWIAGGDLLTVGLSALHHEGFEEFIEDGDQSYVAAVARWGDLDPWGRLGVIYRAVETVLKPRSWEIPREMGDPVHELESCLARLDWARMFGGNDDPLRAQHTANIVLTRARALAPARLLLAELEKSEDSFEGFALVKPGTDTVLVNRMGACIYAERAEAEKWIEISSRRDEDEDEDDAPSNRIKGDNFEAEIVFVVVSTSAGLQIFRPW
jgi:hypothetical protein